MKQGPTINTTSTSANTPTTTTTTTNFMAYETRRFNAEFIRALQ